MPTRSRSHILETESRRAFGALLPSELVNRPLESDYGIDEQVEVFHKAGSALGLMFLAQLKATDAPNRRSALKVSLRVDTLGYYHRLGLPRAPWPTHRRFRNSSSALRPRAETSGNIAFFSPLLFPVRIVPIATVPIQGVIPLCRTRWETQVEDGCRHQLTGKTAVNGCA